MRIIVTGSVAFDYLMMFPGAFREHVIGEKTDSLSVSFLVDSLKKQHGGTAANIAYTLALLGTRPEVVAAVGEDFADYRQHLDFHGVNTEGMVVVPGEFTSSCFVNTDQVNNQITAFYPGAMTESHTLSLAGLGLKTHDLVIISPNDPKAMAGYARECRELSVPYDEIIRALKQGGYDGWISAESRNSVTRFTSFASKSQPLTLRRCSTSSPSWIARRMRALSSMRLPNAFPG